MPCHALGRVDGRGCVYEGAGSSGQCICDLIPSHHRPRRSLVFGLGLGAEFTLFPRGANSMRLWSVKGARGSACSRDGPKGLCRLWLLRCHVAGWAAR